MCAAAGGALPPALPLGSFRHSCDDRSPALLVKAAPCVPPHPSAPCPRPPSPLVYGRLKNAMLTSLLAHDAALARAPHGRGPRGGGGVPDDHAPARAARGAAVARAATGRLGWFELPPPPRHGLLDGLRADVADLRAQLAAAEAALQQRAAGEEELSRRSRAGAAAGA